MSDVRYRAGGWVADVAADGTILTGSVADDDDGNGEYQQHRANLHDIERIHPPESDDERAERHERLWQWHFAEYLRLTGKEPERTAPTLTAEDVARLRGAVNSLENWDPLRPGDCEAIDAIRAVLAKLEGR